MNRRTRRGRPARIDRDRIVAVARGMDPRTLTMQAVAAELGVDRKSLNYHVSDRDGLLELVAADIPAAQVQPLPVAGDWERTLRSFAVSMHEALVGLGTLLEYVRVPIAPGEQTPVPGEQLLAALIEAGFTAREAGRAVLMMSQFVYSAARDAILTAAGGGTHPQVAALLADIPITGDRAQLDFDLDVLVAGLRALRAARSGAAAESDS